MTRQQNAALKLSNRNLHVICYFLIPLILFRFRTCLKDASTDQSAMVGRVYFNLLGMKCFEFEMEEVCVERSWWGWCQKTEEQIVAEVRGSLSWT